MQDDERIESRSLHQAKPMSTKVGAPRSTAPNMQLRAMNANAMMTINTALASTNSTGPPPSPSPSPSAAASAPSLTIDLAEPILALAIHQAAISSLWSLPAIAQPLNVLPHSAAPLATKSALVHLPHVDLDVASKTGNVDLLRFMLKWSKQPGGRPVHYSGDIYCLMKQGNLDVLNWWIKESGGLVLKWNEEYCLVFEQGHVHVLEWWRELGFPHLDEVELDWCLSKVGGKDGVRVLDWCAQYLPADDFKCAAQKMAASGLGLFTHGHDGNLHVLKWWLAKSVQVGWIDMSAAFAGAIVGALQGNQVCVLEWCKEHIHAVGELTHKRALESAVEGPHFAWIETLGVKVSEDEYVRATQAACACGNVDALKWLKRKGYLAGSWSEMMVGAIDADESKSGTSVDASVLQVLDWIHKQRRQSLGECPRVSDFGPGDPYLVACRSGRVHVLDWLHLNGYPMRDSASSLGAYFDAASGIGHVLALEWLDSHVDSRADVDLLDIAFMSALTTASRAECHGVVALDWWWEKLTAIGAFQDLTSSEYADEDGTIDMGNMIYAACNNGAIDIVQWWLQKNQEAGPLKGRLIYEDGYLPACLERGWFPRPNCIAMLRKFHEAGVEMDFASCIYLASTHGKLDVLDWLLNEAKAPLEAFLDAFNPADEFKYYDLLSDCNAYQRSHDGTAMLWWRHNIPQVRGLTLTASPANERSSPINLYLLGAVLKVQGIPRLSMRNINIGAWAMLYYLRDHGILTESGLPEEENDWSLEQELIFVSAKRPPDGSCAALEWWRSSFPEQFACPVAISSGSVPVWEVARRWWLRSGLCGADSAIATRNVK